MQRRFAGEAIASDLIGAGNRYGTAYRCTQWTLTLHEYEQDFGTKTHDSPLGYALVVGDGACGGGRASLHQRSWLT